MSPFDDYSQFLKHFLYSHVICDEWHEHLNWLKPFSVAILIKFPYTASCRTPLVEMLGDPNDINQHSWIIFVLPVATPDFNRRLFQNVIIGAIVISGLVTTIIWVLSKKAKMLAIRHFNIFHLKSMLQLFSFVQFCDQSNQHFLIQCLNNLSFPWLNEMNQMGFYNLPILRLSNFFASNIFIELLLGSFEKEKTT